MTAPKYTPDLASRFYALRCQGKTLSQIATEFLVDRRVFPDWAKDEDKPEFKEAYELGEQAAESHWEGLGQDNLDNPRFKESLYKFITGTRFGWSEKLEKTIKNTTPALPDAELSQLIMEKLKALGLSESDAKSE